ncbi:citrate synthase [Methylobacterium frigidaeris]|uniref:citrate synthase (unknown stereospecificity) n=1 Tax=Methylobacterium frigidaeris TaxID=2038277 RepID=A0AA37HB80_9HYPH|nr:citrate synthase [Methylobacterium frigidaeris]PIK73922.1 excisionase [Methylobacterium frigidaeris]GJD62720.1 Citrate synthase 2 [Methylobacterium frigidaeris]
MTAFLTAAEAAARLGVSRQTLYAYVSRGLIEAHPTADPRVRAYAAEAVARLAASRHRGRRPREVARAALDWGLPVMETAVTLIRDGRLYYRGTDALVLSETATLEEVAALLWALPQSAAFGSAAPEIDGRGAEPRGGDLLGAFAVATEDDPTAPWQQDPARLAAGSGALVRLLGACITGRAPDAAPLHLSCAEAWSLDPAGAEGVRRALVLCADHELNASGFTARCVASAGASLRAAVIGGLAALSGSRHGGMTARVEALWDALDGPDPASSLRRQLAGREDLPGFGHPLYPAGDPRAAALLAPLLAEDPRLRAVAAAAQELTGARPALDFALVALRRRLALPRGSAFGLFALGRSVGWIAQGLEQRQAGGLIRPRSVYVGPEP